jgi:hypothetical protein
MLLPTLLLLEMAAVPRSPMEGRRTRWRMAAFKAV